MLGVLVYLIFLFIGYCYSSYLFSDKDIYYRGWMGGIIGNVLLMAGIVVPSVFMGFTLFSHLTLIVLSAIPLIFMIRKKGFCNFT